MNAIYQQQYRGQPDVFGKTAVLLGGDSAEREISLKSGEAILRALESKGLNVVAIDPREGLLQALQAQSVERVFIALHGPGGEDGKVQAILDMLKIPYTGSGHAASAIAMDKRKAKLIWQALGLPTPKSVMLQGDSDWQVCLQELGGQAFVKPVHEGSSIGMSCAVSPQQLQQAYTRAAEYDLDVLAEQRIIGREYTVAILGSQALPVIELLPKNSFYDFDAKYLSAETEYVCPAVIPDAQRNALQALATEAFFALGCQGWGRVDFMVSDSGELNLLEVNTVPGMTDHSLVPMAAKAVGLDFADLAVEILCQTLS